MKFYNKRKVQRSGWCKVTGPSYHNLYSAKRWCQQNGSSSRFYFEQHVNAAVIKYTTPVWYFEDPEDALVFRLTWLGL